MNPDAPIIGFDGRFRFLRNSCHYTTPAGNRTVEHLYQASKTTDPDMRRHILSALTPVEAHARGQYVALRPNWAAIRRVIMYSVLIDKFTVPQYRRMLLETGDAPLVNWNNYGDTYWGVFDGKGQNELGNLLMLARTRAQKERFG